MKFNMEALYTETLEELLVNQGYGTEHQTQSLTEILNLMQEFPDFEFSYEGLEIAFSMKELFIDKYDIREIGAETEQLFMHFWKERTQEIIVSYVPKIAMWLNHFNDLFKFTVELKESEEYTKGKTNTRTNDLSKELSGENSLATKYYLNPVNASVETLKTKDVESSSGSSSGTETNTGTVEDEGEETLEKSKTRDVLQSVWGKTRANLLKQIFDLQSIYTEALLKFEDIFMGVL